VNWIQCHVLHEKWPPGFFRQGLAWLVWLGFATWQGFDKTAQLMGLQMYALDVF